MSIEINITDNIVEVTPTEQKVDVNITENPIEVNVTDQIILIAQTGLPGPQGPPGPGVAVGGTTGQILAKNSATNYDTLWIDNKVGTVTSINASGVTGISVSGGPITSSGTLLITNTAPDQIVSLTQGGTTSISGTYPNFTISSADQYSGTVTSVNMSVPTGLTISGNPITSSGTLAIGLASGYSIPTTANQTNWNTAYNDSIVSAAVTGTTTKTLTLTQQDAGTITASWTDINTDAVSSVFGRTGAVVAVEGDYTLTQLGDVTITTPSIGQVLKYNGSSWVNNGDAGLTSVGLSMPVAFSVANTPLTSNGTLAVTAVGTSAQYIRGDGQLATLPSGSSGGSSVNYYLNGSINQGTIGGSVYYEMNRNAIIGVGTDFTRTNASGNGLIAQFITDAGDPNRLEIPGGAWNFEMYFSASSNGGSPSFYVELLKYDGTTFTSIASNVSNPEVITGGTLIDLYVSSLAVSQTTLLVTDRLAIRVYITTSGKDITLHTEDNHLCEIVTTFAGGVSSLNGLTANTQYFAVGTSGTDFAISSVSDTHTFNLPTASATNRGALSSTDWTSFNNKQNALTNPVTGTGTTNEISYWTSGSSIGSLTITTYPSLTELSYVKGVTSSIQTQINSKFTLPSLTSGSVLFSNGTTIVQDNANFFWDDTNNRLGLGNAAPTTTLDITGTFKVSGTATLSSSLNVTGVSTFSDITGIGGVVTQNNLNISRAIVGAVTANGIQITSQVGSSVTTAARYYSAIASTAAGFTLPDLFYYRAAQSTFNGTVTNQYGYAVESTLIGATNNYGFRGAIPSGANRWNLYMDGTAINYLNGALLIGSATDDTINKLQVTGSGKFSSSVTASSLIKSGGTSAQFLKADGSVDSNTYGTFTLPSLTNGSVLFSNGTTIAQNNANLNWDNTNAALGIGTSSQVTNANVTIKGKGAVGSTFFLLGYDSASVQRLTIFDNGNIWASDITATSFIKSGGTAAQILAADGSVITAGTNVTISGGTISASGGGGSMAIGGSITSATAGSVLFAGTSGVLSQDNANFFWDDANNRLGIGTITPAYTIDITGSFRMLHNTNYPLLIVGRTSVRYATMTWDDPAGEGLFQTYARAFPLTFDASTVKFMSSGSIRMRIFETSGNILIQNGGTFTDAGFRLDVNGTGRFNGNVNVEGAAYPSLNLVGNTSTSGGGVKFFGTTTQFGEIFGEYESATNGRMYFRTRKAGTISNALTITSSGSVLIGTTTPSVSAITQIDSTTQGFLPPRMTTTQKNAIASPVAGLIIYDSTLNKLCVRTTSAWEIITSI